MDNTLTKTSTMQFLYGPHHQQAATDKQAQNFEQRHPNQNLGQNSSGADKINWLLLSDSSMESQFKQQLKSSVRKYLLAVCICFCLNLRLGWTLGSRGLLLLDSTHNVINPQKHASRLDCCFEGLCLDIVGIPYLITQADGYQNTQIKHILYFNLWT